MSRTAADEQKLPNGCNGLVRPERRTAHGRFYSDHDRKCLMYEACFGLQRRPFASVPDIHQYFPGEAVETARQTLARCVERAEGVGMLVGPSGTGKTLLCRLLADQFRNTLAVALLCSGRLSTRAALYQAVLYELRRPYRGMDEGELRLALVDYLTTSDHRPDGLALLVDEAHTLSLRLLDEIRMLTNLVCNGQSRVRVVLVGGSILEERFASPKLESFAQRLVARCYLESFSRAETQQYIRFQIDTAGGQGLQMFSSEATEAVHQATDGVPRLINQLCDHALLLASADGEASVDARRVEEAWADLQQLPTPWNGDQVDAAAGANVIEFGSLDDEPPSDPRASRSTAAAELHLSDTGSADDLSEARMNQIEDALAELETPAPQNAEPDEEEFRPAGTIRPETEVVFDDWVDPFGEQFEHEEVVVDRYAGTPPPPTAAESPDTVPMQRRGAAEPLPPTDDDLIIIEDEEAETPPKPRRTVIARPREYRQLFAKLRHG